MPAKVRKSPACGVNPFTQFKLLLHVLSGEALPFHTSARPPMINEMAPVLVSDPVSTAVTIRTLVLPYVTGFGTVVVFV